MTSKVRNTENFAKKGGGPCADEGPLELVEKCERTWIFRLARPKNAESGAYWVISGESLECWAAMESWTVKSGPRGYRGNENKDRELD